ncbi:methyl-accepting chemotaxis protein [Desulfurispira natronophila]|uniref:Methyl-accepting chemotaxis protein n=2 Tax=Desulfurispira natronophila TaxID=682562 RepID=A0A7W7Y3G8_9BACT|nr:methyl-accepting chemotaxis protein [Desulfurispira natronophila]
MKVKFMILVLAVGVLFLAGALLLINSEQNRFTQQRIAEIAQQLQQASMDAQTEKEQETLSIAMTLASNQSIHRGIILGDRERDRVLHELSELSQSFADHTETNNLRVQIHDSDGHTYLRTFAPDFYGDDLASFRPTAQRIMQERVPFTALEPGARAITLRALAPIFRAGNYIGAIEISTGFGSISRDFQSRGDRYIVLLNEQGLRASPGLADNRKVGPFTAINDNWFNNETFAFADQVDYQHLQQHGYDMTEKFFVTFAPLVDFEDNEIGLHVVGMPMERFNQAFESSNRIIGFMLFTMVASIVAIVVTVYFLLRYVVTPPIQLTVQSASTIADGDFRQELPVNTNDEFGQLAQAFNRMGEELSRALHQINHAVNNLSAKSVTMSDTAQQLTSGAESQSNATSELAAATHQMSSTVDQIAQNIHSSSEHAQSTLEASSAGNVAVQHTIEKIQHIATNVHESAESVGSLGDAVGEISEFTGVIDDIADQTNLLALNAAIEAARAGDSGRGFAVVADEVRKLAERTQESTAEINSKIAELETQARQAVKSIAQSVELVDEGRDTANIAGERLQDITRLADDLADMTSQIAAAAQEQAATTSQIAGNVESVQGIANGNAQLAQDITIAADELSRIADTLGSQTAQFQLKARAEQGLLYTGND